MLATSFVACTSLNPSFVDPGAGSDGGGGADGAVVDLAGDLSGLKGDLMPMCVEGARSCLAGGSGGCVGGMMVNDRRCPVDSACKDGLCQPPPSGTGPTGASCNFGGGPSENNCFSQVTDNLSCQPFVNSSGSTGRVEWFCAKAVGQGLPGAPCTSGGQCRSGFCGSNGTCFRACSSVADCPMSGGGLLRCMPVTFTVEGVPVTASSCIP